MKNRTLLILVALVVGSLGASAQWLTHPTPGIPRTKDGKPNLTAPAPRAAVAPAPAASSRPAPAPRASVASAASISGLDKGLAVGAALIAVLVLVRVLMLV